MKELSIEEKAKAYDEALKVLHKYDGAHIMFTQDLKEEMFPELREEYEDERMVKFIKNQLFNIKKTITDNYKLDTELTEAIDWLEKQDEHANFRNKIQIGDKVTRNEDGVLVNLSQLKRVAKKDEKQGWQKSVEWSKEDEEMIIKICQNLHDYPHIKSPFDDESFNEALKEVQFIKSLKDRVLPQPKAEWSEEDEYYYGIIKYILNNECVGKTDKKNANNWFKSLKERYTWKPSDSQMASITCAVRKMKESACYDSELVSLLNDLKKLKG